MKLKQIVILGSVSFTVLIILATIFYKERTVFTDIAFHLFYIVKEGNFAIQNNRFGAIFTQIFPVIGVKMNASLDSIMLVYSVGFSIYYFIIFILIATVFKNRQLALIMLLWPVLFVSHTFYWIQSELPQGLAFMLLFFSFYDHVVNNNPSSVRWKFFIIIALFIVSGFHPILFIPFTFIVLFKIISLENTKKKESKFLIILSVLLFLFTAIKSLFINTSGYETSALGGLHNFIKLFPNYITLESNTNFIINCLRLYYFIPILLAIVLYHYYKNGLKSKLWLTITFFFGYLLIVNVSYYHNAPPHYIENLYLPLSIFILFPLIYDVIPNYKYSVQKVLIIFIVFAGIIRIYFIHSTYTERLNWEINYLEENNKKLLVDNRLVPMDTLIDTWATPYEFWLLSTSQNNESASVIFTDSIAPYYYWLPENKMFFIKTNLRYPYEEFDNEYFKFNDTLRYTVRTPD